MEAAVLEPLLMEIFGQLLQEYIGDKLTGELTESSGQILEAMSVMSESNEEIIQTLNKTIELMSTVSVGIYMLIGIITAFIFVYVITATMNRRR